MATMDSIANLLRQHEEIDRASNPSADALSVDEQESGRERRNLGSSPNVMREAFEAAIRMRRRAKDVR
jgi:hypothetical protein